MATSEWSAWGLTVSGNASFITTGLVRDMQPVLLKPGMLFREYLEWTPPLDYDEAKELFCEIGNLEHMVEVLHGMDREVVRMFRVRT